MINLELLLQTLYFKKCDLNPSSCQTDRTESRDAIASKKLLLPHTPDYYQLQGVRKKLAASPDSRFQKV